MWDLLPNLILKILYENILTPHLVCQSMFAWALAYSQLPFKECTNFCTKFLRVSFADILLLFNPSLDTLLLHSVERNVAAVVKSCRDLNGNSVPISHAFIHLHHLSLF